MNRRTFQGAALATLLTPFARASDAQQTTSDVPGYQIAEINDGQLSTGFGGMAMSLVAVDDNTLFQVASCSKIVTALAVLTLVRDGRIDLDQPADQYLQRWQLSGPRGTTTTVAELLSHTAGTSVHGFAGYGPDDPLPTLLDILDGRAPANSDAIRTRRRLLNGFSYSGGGTTVLQALIEDVTRTDFATYTMIEVLRPVGAPLATFAIEPRAPFAHGSYEDGQPLPGGFKRHSESAAAGLWATATDLTMILQAVVRSLAGANDALLPAALARRMVTPVSQQSGLGIFVHPDAIIFHDGRNYGFDSIVAAELEAGRISYADLGFGSAMHPRDVGHRI